MATPTFPPELNLACTAVQLSSLLTKRLQQQTLAPSSSISKSDFSPVTIGDFAVQALLTAAIHTHPGWETDSFLAEESADELRSNAALLEKVWELIEEMRPFFAGAEVALGVPRSREEVCDLIDLGGKNARSDAGRTWVFDPIDGTATFIEGKQYSINLALLHAGHQALGVIGCPNLPLTSPAVSETTVDTSGHGLMIFALRGQGTYIRPMQANGVLLPATKIERHGDTATMDNLIFSDCSSYTSTILDLHRQVAARLGCEWPGVDLYSSILKYAVLGLGRSSVVMRIFKFASWRSNMWDHAGAVLIFEEAGGKVTDLEGKAIDFTVGRKMGENYGLVCAPSSVHADVLKVVQDVLAAYGPIPWDRQNAQKP